MKDLLVFAEGEGLTILDFDDVSFSFADFLFVERPFSNGDGDFRSLEFFHSLFF